MTFFAETVNNDKSVIETYPLGGLHFAGMRRFEDNGEKPVSTYARFVRISEAHTFEDIMSVYNQHPNASIICKETYKNDPPYIERGLNEFSFNNIEKGGYCHRTDKRMRDGKPHIYQQGNRAAICTHDNRCLGGYCEYKDILGIYSAESITLPVFRVKLKHSAEPFWLGWKEATQESVDTAIKEYENVYSSHAPECRVWATDPSRYVVQCNCEQPRNISIPADSIHFVLEVRDNSVFIGGDHDGASWGYVDDATYCAFVDEHHAFTEYVTNNHNILSCLPM